MRDDGRNSDHFEIAHAVFLFVMIRFTTRPSGPCTNFRRACTAEEPSDSPGNRQGKTLLERSLYNGCQEEGCKEGEEAGEEGREEEVVLPLFGAHRGAGIRRLPCAFLVGLRPYHRTIARMNEPRSLKVCRR